MAKRGSCEIRLAMALLLALSAAAFSVSHAARVSSSAEGPAPAAAPVEESDNLYYPLLPPINDPVVIRCAKTLIKADYCGLGLLEAVLSGKVNLPKSCCVAINRMSDYCFTSIFTVRYFGVVLPREIKSFCAAPAPVSSFPSA